MAADHQFGPQRDTDQLSVESSNPAPIVVGIGTSAGGLAALKTFFAHVPANMGFAYVVVIHLSPQRESRLAELLQPYVKMPVGQVTATVPIEPDRVYVIPPGCYLSAIDTHLRPLDVEPEQGRRAPIDHFLRTLARTHDGASVAVILTGTGSDGTSGIGDIKEKGGLTVVQSPEEAEFDGMPNSAIATGVVDLVLPLAAIPEAILRFARTAPRVPVPPDGEELERDEQKLLQQVFAQLRSGIGRDFSRYKRSTILRRITRRMQLSQVEELGDYLKLLRSQPEETRALADDLLITVTRFFRDPKVFHKLATAVLPAIFDTKSADDELRVWVVGCATGEEAYSLAMLLLEAAECREAPPRLQIFASDLHERSLERAREGVYPGDIEVDVSTERLNRFFKPDDLGYRIRKEIRDLVVFAPHNLLGDPPFSRLDLIACRNLLIYLRRDVQEEVVALFHYALNDDGFLVLGTSEIVDAADLFRIEHKTECIYRKRNVPALEPRLPIFPSTRLRFPDPPQHADVAATPVHFGELHQRMVERLALPSLLIGADDKVVHLSEHVGRYLLHPGGELTANVYKLVRPELRLELRSAVQAMREQNQPQRTRAIAVQFNGESGQLVLDLRPSFEPYEAGFALVIFDERPAPADEPDPEGPSEARESVRVRALEAELELTRRRLQATVEKYETSREQMKSSNQELQSINEELRSTMEELETGKEELQSMNEELQTVNEENRRKVQELAQLSNDLQNFMAATDIATLFLDRGLRIVRYTPRVGELFKVRPADQGRSILDLSHRVRYEALQSDSEQVFRQLIPVERELQDDAGRWYLTRVLPYRSADERIEGVVINFVDITSQKEMEIALRETQQRQDFFLQLGDALRETTDARKVMADTADRVGHFLGVDRVGYAEIDESGNRFTVQSDWTREAMSSLAGDHGLEQWGPALVAELRAGRAVAFDDVLTHPLTSGTKAADAYRRASTRAAITVPLLKDRRLVAAFYVHRRQPYQWQTGDQSLVVEVAERTWAAVERARAEDALEGQKIYAESIIDTLHEPFLVLTSDLRVRSASPHFYEHFRVRPDETEGRLVYELGNGQWNIPRLRILLEDVLPDNNAFNDFEVVHEFEGLGHRMMLLNARRIDHVQLILVGIHDITEQKRTEKALRELNDSLERRVETRTMEVRELASRLGRAEREERRRISQILHDELQQLLYGVEMKLGTINKSLRPEDQSQVKGDLEDARGLLRQAVRTTRQLTVSLNPPILRKEGLVAALAWLRTQMRELHQLEVTVEADHSWYIRDADLRVLLFQIVQELLFNVKKHAGVDRATVRLSEDEGRLTIHVIDAGKGFATESLVESRNHVTGFGLVGARERLQILGGSLEIKSVPDEGTQVTLYTPARLELPE